MLTRRAAIAAVYGAARIRCLAQGNSSTVELPARLNRQNQIQIPVSVNDGPQLWCLLDTGGARNMYLSPKRAAALGIFPSFAGRSSGPLDTSPRLDLRAHVTLDVGSLHLTNQQLLIKDASGPEDGTVGAAIFSSFIIELDYQTPAVLFHPMASFHYQGLGAAIPFDLWSNAPQIVGWLTIDDLGPVKTRMTVDTGAGGAVFLAPKFNDELRRQGRVLPWIRTRGGLSTCRIDRIAVGNFFMKSLIVHLLPVQGFGSDAGAPDALLGVGFLGRFRIFLDYAKKEMILEPNIPQSETV
jgi:hypothetical protein